MEEINKAHSNMDGPFLLPKLLLKSEIFSLMLEEDTWLLFLGFMLDYLR